MRCLFLVALLGCDRPKSEARPDTSTTHETNVAAPTIHESKWTNTVDFEHVKWTKNHFQDCFGHLVPACNDADLVVCGCLSFWHNGKPLPNCMPGNGTDEAHGVAACPVQP